MQHNQGPCSIEDYFIEQTKDAKPDKDLDFNSILDFLVNKYQLQVHRGKWPALTNPRDRRNAPPSFGAAAVHLSQANTLVENLANVRTRKPLRPNSGRPNRNANGKAPSGSSSATVQTSNRSGNSTDRKSVV